MRSLWGSRTARCWPCEYRLVGGPASCQLRPVSPQLLLGPWRSRFPRVLPEQSSPQLLTSRHWLRVRGWALPKAQEKKGGRAPLSRRHQPHGLWSLESAGRHRYEPELVTSPVPVPGAAVDSARSLGRRQHQEGPTPPAQSPASAVCRARSGASMPLSGVLGQGGGCCHARPHPRTGGLLPRHPAWSFGRHGPGRAFLPHPDSRSPAGPAPGPAPPPGLRACDRRLKVQQLSLQAPEEETQAQSTCSGPGRAGNPGTCLHRHPGRQGAHTEDPVRAATSPGGSAAGDAGRRHPESQVVGPGGPRRSRLQLRHAAPQRLQEGLWAARTGPGDAQRNRAGCHSRSPGPGLCGRDGGPRPPLSSSSRGCGQRSASGDTGGLSSSDQEAGLAHSAWPSSDVGRPLRRGTDHSSDAFKDSQAPWPHGQGGRACPHPSRRGPPLGSRGARAPCRCSSSCKGVALCSSLEASLHPHEDRTCPHGVRWGRDPDQAEGKGQG